MKSYLTSGGSGGGGGGGAKCTCPPANKFRPYYIIFIVYMYVFINGCAPRKKLLPLAFACQLVPLGGDFF